MDVVAREHGRLILASASPRRRLLLEQAGYEFDVIVADVDEQRHPGEAPVPYAARVAAEKAAVIAAKHPDRPVLAADTVVVMDGEVMGKPVDARDARRMLAALGGRRHEVVTAVAVQRGSRLWTAVEITAVWMRELSPAELDWYIASGEPMDKAGAYAIQGRAARFVSRIEGSFSAVVGLPIEAVARLFAEAGVEADSG